jgi:mono/diheme cytochrome c family protein
MPRNAHEAASSPRVLWSAGLLAFALLAVIVVDSSRAEDAAGADDVQEGHRLAVLVCSSCHVVARDQPYSTVLSPPAPSFESIAQRGDMTAQAVVSFLSTTHRGVGNPKGMPNPELTDTYAKQVAAYLLSLRKRP